MSYGLVNRSSGAVADDDDAEDLQGLVLNKWVSPCRGIEVRVQGDGGEVGAIKLIMADGLGSYRSITFMNYWPKEIRI